MSVLQGIRVIEFAESVAGEYCGKILAELGAEVVKIEHPGSGSPTRGRSRIKGRADDIEASPVFAYYNTDKRSVAIDLDSEMGRGQAVELIRSASVVIDDRGVQAATALDLTPERAATAYPGLVACAISAFGSDAPDDWNRAESINVFHASGWGYHTPSTPDLSRPPLKGAGCYNSDVEGGLDAAIAILASLVRLGRTDAGEQIDISQQMALINRADTMVGPFLNDEVEPSDKRSAYDMPGPCSSYACADGHVYLFMTSGAHWRGLCQLIGDGDWIADFAPDWIEFGQTDERIATFKRYFAEWIADKPKLAICEQAQQLGTPLVPLNNASDLPVSPQFQHRRFFEPLDHPALGTGLYPTLPFILSKSDARPRTAAPLLGEADLREIIADPATPMRSVPAAPKRTQPDASRGGPLAGIRIVELTKVWAGPYAGKLLAFLGAEVIKIESHFNLDEMRAYGGTDIDAAPLFLSLNNEVSSAQFNLKHPDGMAAFRDLVATSDVVINNLRPGAMERMGLAYDDLRKLREDIISVSLKMYGNEGPLGYQTGYAPCFAALGAMSYLVGYENEAPRNVCIRYGDATAGAHAALATVAALVHRERTGEGQFVDVSAVEAMAAIVGDSLLLHSLTGEIPGPDGNHHPDMAPHGTYPCRDGRWISIAVRSEEGWRALCRELGAEPLADNPRFATVQARQASLAALDAEIAALTAGRDAHALAGALRAEGVGAFVSATSLDIVNDSFLRNSGRFPLVSDYRKGERPIVGPSWRMHQDSPSITRGAPLLGEHNDHVFGTILELSKAEQKALAQSEAMR